MIPSGPSTAPTPTSVNPTVWVRPRQGPNLADLVSDAQVEISDEGNLVLRPANGPAPRTGVIFYGGANADIRGYTTVLRRLAEEGYLVVAVRMPLNMAVFAPMPSARVSKTISENPGLLARRRTP